MSADLVHHLSNKRHESNNWKRIKFQLILSTLPNVSQKVVEQFLGIQIPPGVSVLCQTWWSIFVNPNSLVPSVECQVSGQIIFQHQGNVQLI